jgi:succinate dehydrogenase/fumarate reductase flavoprotein subunit
VIRGDEIDVAGLRLPVFSLNTVVVGSGAAGLNCAVQLHREMQAAGVADPAAEIAVVTRGLGLGTSHNAGSDKQTYYRLGVRGAEPDSPVDMAGALSAGGCVHGDVALAEAENSLRCFYHLVEIGVPFPQEAAGGFVSYRTDYDPRGRATSAGPWTSRDMVQCLLAEVRGRGIAVVGGHHMAAVLTRAEGTGRRAIGILCVDLSRAAEASLGLTLFNCRSVVVAGGGPGELFRRSVYPPGQMGPYAALLEAGAVAQNLAEVQFGLASLEPRWGLSGSYQQVIPRYYSTDAEGGGAQEFLNPWFGSMRQLGGAIFLKGYQWPFDPAKVPDHGSSLVDLLVEREARRGRRVWVDFRTNPGGDGGLGEFRFDELDGAVRDYLVRSGATQATPIERLVQMNPLSVDVFADKGVDLHRQPLEVGVCAQHCNGGFAVDWWWQTNVEQLFAIGELAGTHGVVRPGGAALNAGQVGGLRAAQRITHAYQGEPAAGAEFALSASAAVRRVQRIAALAEDPGPEAPLATEVVRRVQHEMTAGAGMVRSAADLQSALERAHEQWQRIRAHGVRQDAPGYLEALGARELALAQSAFLTAAGALVDRGGGSRGSHLVRHPSGLLFHPDLEDEWRCLLENTPLREEILCVSYDAGSGRFATSVTAPRPVPGTEGWFETAWAEFRSGRVYGGGGGAPRGGSTAG